MDQNSKKEYFSPNAFIYVIVLRIPAFIYFSPNYACQHVRDLNGQAGAPVPDQYRTVMRIDVVPPNCDEVDLVA